MQAVLQVLYGHEVLYCPVLPGFLGEARLPPIRALEPAEFLKRLEGALAGPTGSPPLAVLAKGARSALLVIDDHTRPTPAKDLIGPLLRALASAGIELERIAFLIATGSHRSPLATEVAAKLGHYAQEFPVLIHREEDAVPVGRTSLGLPIQLNRHLAHYDLIIGLGSILPHRYAGWSGGAKIICPGVTGRATNALLHMLIAEDERATLGQVENTVRVTIEEVARRARLAFIVNVIPTADGRPVDVVAGDPVLAHRQGVKQAESVFQVIVPPADVVMVSSYPEDSNLWQATKACYSAARVVRPGGSIILITPAPEGLGEHLDFFRLSCRQPVDIRAAVAQGLIADELGAAAAFALAEVRQRARLYLVSTGVNQEEARAAGCTWAATPKEALQLALASFGFRSDWVYLREGSIMLPQPA